MSRNGKKIEREHCGNLQSKRYIEGVENIDKRKLSRWILKNGWKGERNVRVHFEFWPIVKISSGKTDELFVPLRHCSDGGRFRLYLEDVKECIDED